jgi:AcrR family transcriptional regulator
MRSAARTDRRSEILSRATALFAEAGVANVAMADIAEAVGIQKPSLYHFFQSKEALLRAVLSPVVDEPFAELKKIAESSAPASRKIRDGMVALGRAFARDRDGMEILVREKLERHLSAEAFAEIMRDKAGYTELWRGILRNGVASGELAPLDDKIVAFAIIGALNWMYAWFDPSGELCGEEVADRIAATFLDGLRRKDRGGAMGRGFARRRRRTRKDERHETDRRTGELRGGARALGEDDSRRFASPPA